MLTLTINSGESVYVDGTRIEVEAKGDRVRMRFDGPAKVLREKPYLQDQKERRDGESDNTGDTGSTA